MPTAITPIRLTDEDLAMVKEIIGRKYGERVNTISGAVKFSIAIAAAGLMPAAQRRAAAQEIAKRFKGDETRIVALIESTGRDMRRSRRKAK